MTAPRMTRPTELDALEIFSGTIQGKGRAAAGPFGPEHAMSGTLSAQWELGKMWLSFAWTEERTPEHPMPMNGKGYWGYDASAKQYVGVWVDGSGAIMNGTSPGWVDDKLVWTWQGAMMGRPAQVRGAWSRAGGRIISGVWHLDMGEGWIQLMEMTFT